MSDWDNAYSQYSNALKNDTVTEQTIRDLYGSIGPDFANRIVKIKSEIDAQQAAGSKEYYSAGRISADNASWDMAFRLAETGLSSIYNMEKRTVEAGSYNDEYGNTFVNERTQYYNKSTGEEITDKWLSLQGGGGLRTNYNIHFTDDGTPIPYTSKESSDWVKFRDTALKPIAAIVLAAYGVPYVSTALGATSAGASIVAAGGQAALTGVSAGIVSGGVSLIGGNNFEDALKSALTSGLTAGATAGFADTIGQTLGFDAGSVASKAAGNAIIAGAKAGITDENILQSMATAAVSSYLSNKDSVVKATDEDLAAGLDPRYGTNQTYDAFMTNAMTPEARASIETQINPSLMGPQTAEDLGKGFDQYMTDSTFDATANQGSLAKEVKEPGLNLTAKDVKTGIKIAGVLMAGDEVIDRTIGSDDKQITGQLSTTNKDKYRNAPLAGFKMVKYDDPATGGSKYIPFVGEEALLPPPEGYKRMYAKGGFVSKPTKSKGLAGRR